MCDTTDDGILASVIGDYLYKLSYMYILYKKVVLCHFVFSPRKDLLRQDVVHTPASRYQVGRSFRRSTATHKYYRNHSFT